MNNPTQKRNLTRNPVRLLAALLVLPLFAVTLHAAALTAQATTGWIDGVPPNWTGAIPDDIPLDIEIGPEEIDGIPVALINAANAAGKSVGEYLNNALDFRNRLNLSGASDPVIAPAAGGEKEGDGQGTDPQSGDDNDNGAPTDPLIIASGNNAVRNGEQTGMTVMLNPANDIVVNTGNQIAGFTGGILVGAFQATSPGNGETTVNLYVPNLQDTPQRPGPSLYITSGYEEWMAYLAQQADPKTGEMSGGYISPPNAGSSSGSNTGGDVGYNTAQNGGAAIYWQDTQFVDNTAQQQGGQDPQNTSQNANASNNTGQSASLNIRPSANMSNVQFIDNTAQQQGVFNPAQNGGTLTNIPNTEFVDKSHQDPFVNNKAQQQGGAYSPINGAQFETQFTDNTAQQDTGELYISSTPPQGVRQITVLSVEKKVDPESGEVEQQITVLPAVVRQDHIEFTMQGASGDILIIQGMDENEDDDDEGRVKRFTPNGASQNTPNEFLSAVHSPSPSNLQNTGGSNTQFGMIDRDAILLNRYGGGTIYLYSESLSDANSVYKEPRISKVD